MIVALGLGALSTGPHQLAPVSAAGIALPVTALPLTGATTGADPPRPARAPSVVQIYVEAVPTPAAVAGPPKAVAPIRVLSRTPVRPSPARVTGPVSGTANGFAFGYCTWWVAHKRYVPWRGNAAQWWWNARAFGFGEGSAPRAGAIMVMGYSATSPQGHVGYVESVNANGSFVVSEMNWWGVPGGGWGRVDYRTVTSMRGILGFIY